MTDTAQHPKEEHVFQAEVKQLLHLMIHSLYSNKEIFLRELISNASDAADKLRFEAVQTPALLELDPEFKIRLEIDSGQRTLSIIDNGIGMSKEEVIANIGTIAKSGTREFLGRLTGDEAKDARLIGQFGVGFYSAFIVADEVTLSTRRAGTPKDAGVRWSSKGDGSYTLEDIGDVPRGTRVTLHFREGEDSFLEAWQVKSIIKRYSDHIQIPIVTTDEEGKEEVLNQASALWARPKSDISEEQYQEFYKHIAHDFENPLAWSHARVEGRQEYTELLFVPARAPFDLWERDPRNGIKLYVKRVFIMEDAKKLLPNYLRFIRGVIDSNDLPLNVSREILQESKDIDAIRAGCTKKILGLLEDLAENDREKYSTFWKEFGQAFKEGASEEFSNREKWSQLLRFPSTEAELADAQVSLKEYLSRMKEGQSEIYYVTAESFSAAKNSPHLEVFRKRGIEVLLLADRVDEWVVSHLQEFEGKKLVSVAKGDLDLSKLPGAEAAKAEHQEKSSQLKALCDTLKKELGDRVEDVRVSTRLTTSPACVVVPEGALSGHLARMLKAAGQSIPEDKLILELNPDHPMVQRLDAESDLSRVREWALLLLDQSILAEGGHLDDPASFVHRLNTLLMS